MNRKRVHFEIGGVVQGVGFRPYLHRLAERNRLTGWVRNTQSGIELEVQGREEDVDAFRNQFSTNPPPLAVLEKIVAASLDVIPQEQRFDILPSDSEGRGETFVSTDISICDDCLRELTDPHDRRYRYPFINCTNCGPRYTILHALPYDRENTVMKAFPMCGECEAEYKEPATRRYHAQPDCCPECGPRVFYLDGEGKKVEGDPFFLAQRMLSEGKIVAVKGTGGIHLACNGRDEKAVERLRLCKAREEKPLAVMCRSLEAAEKFCRVSLGEKELLESPCRPIVLLEKKKQGGWFWLSGTNRIGIMLPYTPLHVLLLDGVFDGPDCLVMTSANLPGNPVLLENEEAVGALHGIADGFLLHDRPIENRCDDSLVMEWEGRPYFFRRSRGYAPGPVPLSKDSERMVQRKRSAAASGTAPLGAHGVLYGRQRAGQPDFWNYLGRYRPGNGPDGLGRGIFRRGFFQLPPGGKHPSYFPGRRRQGGEGALSDCRRPAAGRRAAFGESSP